LPDWQHFGNRKIRGTGNRLGQTLQITRRIHRVGDLVEPVFKQMAVRVEGHRGRPVTEHLLYDLDVRTGRDRQAALDTDALDTMV
jgi:hypothetical protein